MIRLYVTRGTGAATGGYDNACADRLNTDYMLPNYYNYTLNDAISTSTDYDLGGMWLPHTVTTVIF
jgi:hypothetical protein